MIDPRKIVITFFLFLIPIGAAASTSQKDTAVVVSAIKTCVPQANTPYVGFDAYYNPGNEMVMNNVPGVASDIYEANKWENALFVFQKCMAEQGVPLTKPK